MRYRRDWLLLLVVALTMQGQALLHAAELLTPDLTELEEVIVTGQRSGPRMWKVSQGDHVLWLLGTPNSLPKDVTWDSRDVEAVLAGSQQVLAGMYLKATPGLFSMLPLYMQYRRDIKLAKGQSLKEWLSPESYQRYTALKLRYAPDDELDGYRPLYVAQQLSNGARDRSGLKQRVNVQEAVLKLARKHSVSIDQKTVTVARPAEAIRATLRELMEIPRAKEVACLEATMVSLEADVSISKARANAWALGDVDSLRKLPSRDRSACWEALATSSHVREAQQQVQDYWMSTARKALETNASTLAMRRIDELLGDGGVLAQFRAAGYVVMGP
jgi:uncharacterized protein YbaP (TraB family)